jgi:tricorn protease-like protein/C-terminal processing protease CtpA/Prc
MNMRAELRRPARAAVVLGLAGLAALALALAAPGVGGAWGGGRSARAAELAGSAGSAGEQRGAEPGAGPARDVQPAPAMMRFPAISADRIAFVYANDIWTAPKTGGMASPLSTRPGRESFPRFSPDGKTIAFMASYEGNSELYTLPVEGGEAFRVTHHPGTETLAGWTPDGRLLFLSNAMAGLDRTTQLYTVSPTGGMPERLPVPYGAFGSISQDGQWLAYTLHSTDSRTWKRYRGGMATDVWLFNLNDRTSRRITDWEGTDTLPMWGSGAKAGVVYYLSDAGPEHRLNVWSFDTATGRREQVTRFTEDDVRWASMGPGDGRSGGEIIFQLGATLRVLDVGTGQVREVRVTIPGDRPTIRERVVDASRWISAAAISPTGRRVVVSGRGDLWSLPAREGVARNLTRTDGVFERSPRWSPDGRWIAYFSDETGEYELWVRPSDARGDDRPDAGPAEGAPRPDAGDEGAAGAPAATAAMGAPRRLTDLGPGFRANIGWSPDSTKIVFTDQGGRLYLTDVASGQTRQLDKDPWMATPQYHWSHDSSHLAYTRTDEASRNTVVWLYDLDADRRIQVTSPMFAATAPVIDRKGEWLFFTSFREISSPIYSDLPTDTTWIYTNSEVLLMTPLRADVKSPFLPRSDEEEIKSEKKPSAGPAERKPREPRPSERPPAGGEDGVSGTWACSVEGPGDMIPGGRMPFTLVLKLERDGTVSGRFESLLGRVEFSGATYNRQTGELAIAVSFQGTPIDLALVVREGTLTGSWRVGELNGPISGTRRPSAPGEGPGEPDRKDEPGEDKEAKPEAAGNDKKDEKKDDKKDDKKDEKKKIKVEWSAPEEFESRAIRLPVPPGAFGVMDITHDNKLIYVRRPARGMPGTASIRIFDPREENPEEKTVVNAGWFELSADGRKILHGGGNSWTIADAAPGGGRSSAVPTGGMRQTVRPREEWRQIFNDAWRITRDYFYEPTMHGVDWARVRDHYARALEDAVNREDVHYLIGEMISELNVGHAYIQSPGDAEPGVPPVPVGLLGADISLAEVDGRRAYRIDRIITGAPWDSDARGPLSQPGVDVKVGDFLLEVNGVPIDTARDVYAAFLGTADRVTAITVNARPELDGKQRTVLVRPIASESNLRYRDWIETNRRHVEQRTDGKIGYIYVPNTGVNGQNDLMRQLIGQRGREALIIDERWNGGGQIPTRFIELLNRPRTNYWARRDGRDWPWPPDSHQGPKAMLINGLAGSGGDMFPWLFREAGLGKLIGTRTWGGLVGISGNPQFIDGGSISVPTFGFYKRDGNWGIEGHGVDPDFEVIDDPARMQNGADPQLDFAIDHLLEELRRSRYVPPPRPASPDRSGMGIPLRDR